MEICNLIPRLLSSYLVAWWEEQQERGYKFVYTYRVLQKCIGLMFMIAPLSWKTIVLQAFRSNSGACMGTRLHIAYVSCMCSISLITVCVLPEFCCGFATLLEMCSALLVQPSSFWPLRLFSNYGTQKLTVPKGFVFLWGSSYTLV